MDLLISESCFVQTANRWWTSTWLPTYSICVQHWFSSKTVTCSAITAHTMTIKTQEILFSHTTSTNHHHYHLVIINNNNTSSWRKNEDDNVVAAIVERRMMVMMNRLSLQLMMMMIGSGKENMLVRTGGRFGS